VREKILEQLLEEAQQHGEDYPLEQLLAQLEAMTLDELRDATGWQHE